MTDMPLSMAEKSKQETAEKLYGQSIRLSIIHPVAAFIIATWFSFVAPLNNIGMWLVAVCALSLIRIFLCNVFERYNNPDNMHLWIHAWVGLSSVFGIIYSSAFIAFSPVDQSAYVLSVGMFITALSAVSILSYGVSRLAILSFFIPVTVPSIIYFGLKAGDAGLMLAVALSFYSIVVLSLMNNIREAFKKSITLNYQHQQEVEKRQMIEKQLQDISRRDGLTGLFNRRYFDEVLEIEIGRALRNHSPLCLVMFDIDCFAEYNEEYGHIAGDNCLIAVAEIVEQLASRKGDLIARYGGEEFAIILPNSDIEGAISFANKLQQSIQNKRIPHLTSKLTSLKCVTVSVGVTNLLPFSQIQAKAFVEAADRAVHEAKRDGRNRVFHIANNGISQNHV